MVERALDAGVQRGRLWGRECEFDERKLYLAQSFSSMFAYCVEELGFSEDATYNRIGVARAGRRLPALIEAVRSGKIHLAGVRLLVPHLTGQNHLDLLAQAAGKSKRQIDAMIAKLFPKPAVPATIRKIPSRPSLALSIPPRVALCVPPESELSLLPELELLRPSALTAPPPPRQAQHLAAILEAALDLLIQKVKKERFAVGRKTRTAPPPSPVAPEVEGHRATQHIPDPIKRAVYERDAAIGRHRRFNLSRDKSSEPAPLINHAGLSTRNRQIRSVYPPAQDAACTRPLRREARSVLNAVAGPLRRPALRR